MTLAKKIYLVGSSLEEDRPLIDFTLRENKRNAWLTVGEVLDGERSVSDYPGVELLVKRSDAPNWDFYSVPGTLGLFSERAIGLFIPYATRFFDPVGAELNGAPFFFLREKRALACLDRENSIVVPFASNPSRIMEIHKFVFHQERVTDPLLFRIPELRRLLATQSIKRIIDDKQLKGFSLIDTETGKWDAV
jgi:hypothetical protein